MSVYSIRILSYNLDCVIVAVGDSLSWSASHLVELSFILIETSLSQTGADFRFSSSGGSEVCFERDFARLT